MNPLMNTDNSHWSAEESCYFWEVDLESLGLEYSKLDDVRVVAYNTDLYGKNPYYVCTLKDFIPERNPSGWKQACYNS